MKINLICILLVSLTIVTSQSHSQSLSEDTIDIEEVVVTGNRIKVAKQNVPLSISVINEKELEVSFHDGGQFQTQIIKGKRKNGGFSFKKKTKWFGIPLLFFLKNKTTHILYMNNDLGIVIESENTKSQMFFFEGKTSKLETEYHFDKAI